ncbi:hypothetical protein KKE60_07895 [Patescibacteria group bacterium]|nr:hypothetical protein [Patescibacteria group bacterium]
MGVAVSKHLDLLRTTLPDLPRGKKMPCPHKKHSNPGKHKKHTPIVSEKQRGLFGAEYARRKAGKQRRMKGITTEELRSHLKEAGGKRLSLATTMRRKYKKIRGR